MIKLDEVSKEILGIKENEFNFYLASIDGNLMDSDFLKDFFDLFNSNGIYYQYLVNKSDHDSINIKFIGLELNDIVNLIPINSDASTYSVKHNMVYKIVIYCTVDGNLDGPGRIGIYWSKAYKLFRRAKYDKNGGAI